MNLNTLIRFFVACLLLVGIFSCQDDDVLYPDGSRDLTINIQTSAFSGEHFCIVTDEEGSLWFDMVFDEEQSTHIVKVPVGFEIDLTIGVTTDFSSRLSTFKNIDEEFTINNFVMIDCDDDFFVSHFGETTRFRITGIQDPEVIQSGFGFHSNELVNAIDQTYSFESSIQTSEFVDNPLLVLIMRDNSTSDVRSLVLDPDELNGATFYEVDFGAMKEVVRHDIILDRPDSYVMNLEAKTSSNLVLLENGSVYAGGSIPSTNIISVFLPESLTFQTFALRVTDSRSFLGQISEINKTYTSLPTSLSVPQGELFDIGTNANNIHFDFTGEFDFLSCALHFGNSSTWDFYQRGSHDKMFSVPNIPVSVLEARPNVAIFMNDPFQINVAGSIFENKLHIPTLDRKISKNPRKCSGVEVTSATVNL